MFELTNIRIVRNNNISTLACDVKTKKEEFTLWYKVDSKYEKFLCAERADAFVVSLIMYAMKSKEDIVVKDSCLSDKLLFNLNNYIIPVLAKNSKTYHKIKVESKSSGEKLENYNYNGTGLSCGVDSLSTLKESTIDAPDSLKVNMLTFFNVGAHGTYGEEENERLFISRRAESEEIALKNGFEFISVDSNISMHPKQPHIECHIFRSASAVLAIQKAFKNYYYSSGYEITDFEINDKRTAKAEVYYLSMLSNENVNFYSSGAPKSRLEKAETICNYDIAMNSLNVCVVEVKNCSKCEKCIRTMFEFYSLGKLQNFKKVFDLESFKKRKTWYESEFMKEYYLRKKDYIDTYKQMKKNRMHISLIGRISGFIKFLKLFLKSILKRLLPKRVKDKIKKWSKKC